MKKKYFIINSLLLLILVACKKEKKIEESDKPSASDVLLEMQKKDYSKFSKNSYDDSTSLVLGFHRGMSARDVVFVANQELINEGLLYNAKGGNPRKGLLEDDRFIASKHFSNQTAFNVQEELIPMFLTDELHFPINFDNVDYIMKFNIGLMESQLIHVELTGPIAFTDSEIKNKEWERIKNGLIKLYKAKYGAPKISKRALGAFDNLILDSNPNRQPYDSRVYVFNDEYRRIEIYQKLGQNVFCIRYELSTDYQRREKEKERLKGLEEKDNKSKAKKTLESI